MTNGITVVIASYNYGHLIAQCIESVLAQTIKPTRILVVDDGSSDNTVEIANKYGLEVIQRKNNLGVIENYNDVLFNHIKTKKVMFLGGDDYLNPQYLEKMNLDYDIVSCDITLVGPYAHKVRKGMRTEFKDGYWIWRFQPTNILRKNYIHGSSVFNAELAKRVGGYEAMRNRKMKKEEDWKCWRKMIGAGGTHFHVPVNLLFYRQHAFNNNR